MPEPSDIELPGGLRLEIRLLAAFLIVFGVVNQIGQLLESADPLTLPLEVPGGAAVLPGVFLLLSGVGTLLRHEWGFKLGCILCLMHLAISSVGWPLSMVEIIYVIACAVGAFESWRVLRLTRAITNHSS